MVQSGLQYWFSLGFSIGSVWATILVQSGLQYWFSLGFSIGSVWSTVLVQSGLQYWFSLGFSIGSVWASVLTLQIAQTFVSVILKFWYLAVQNEDVKLTLILLPNILHSAFLFSFFHISKWLNFTSWNFLKYWESLPCKEEGERHFNETSNTARVSGS